MSDQSATFTIPSPPRHWRKIARFLLIVAGSGLILLFVGHFATYFGLFLGPNLPGTSVFMLGMFGLGLTAIAFYTMLYHDRFDLPVVEGAEGSDEEKDEDQRPSIIGHAATPLVLGTFFFFTYAVVNFFIFAVVFFFSGANEVIEEPIGPFYRESSGERSFLGPSEVRTHQIRIFRLWTGHMMLFYCLFMALFSSMLRDPSLCEEDIESAPSVGL